MITSKACGTPNDFHGVANKAVRSVVHAESHIEVRQWRHDVFGKLFLHSTQKSAIGRPVIFVLPAKGAHSQGGAEAAPQLLVLL